MHVWDPQNPWHCLEVFKIYFLAPAVVKHCFFIDPNGITTQNCEILSIIMITCARSKRSGFSCFRSCHFLDRFGCDVAHIAIYMNISPLPCLDICHEHWALAGETIWQHVFTCFPAMIYCSSVGKHLRASSLATTNHFWKLAFGVVHKLMLNVQLFGDSRVGRSSVSKEYGFLVVSLGQNVLGKVTTVNLALAFWWWLSTFFGRGHSNIPEQHLARSLAHPKMRKIDKKSD